MPSPLFDYVEGSFHTMGLSPLAPLPCGADRVLGETLVKNNVAVGSIIGGVARCDNATPQPGGAGGLVGLSPAGAGTTSYCNPASDGKRFSFTFPSGKKWTLSRKDDASARMFYCPRGTGPLPMPDVPPTNTGPVGPVRCPPGGRPEVCKYSRINCSQNPRNPCCCIEPETPAENLDFCRNSLDQMKCSAYWLANKCVVNITGPGPSGTVQCPPKQGCPSGQTYYPEFNAGNIRRPDGGRIPAGCYPPALYDQLMRQATDPYYGALPIR